MHISSIITLLAAASPALAAVGGHCSSGPKEGICLHIKDCKKAGGTYTDNNCKFDGNDVKCCEITGCGSSSSPFVWSQCRWTADGCKAAGSAWWETNRCPGGDNFRCCNMNNKPLPPKFRVKV